MGTGEIAAAVEPNRILSARWLKIHSPDALVITVFVGLALRLFSIISRYAVNIFFSDQWDFNDATLFQKHSLWQMFDWQHGPHRQGLGALFAKLVEPVFAWNSRTEAFVVGGVIVTAAICALLLKKRLFGSLSVSDVVIPAMFLTPAQHESLFVTANFAHGPLPLLLIVLYSLAWTVRRSVTRYALVLLVNFVTIYTGFGFFVGVLTPILLLVDNCTSGRELRVLRINSAIPVLVSIASFASFFIGYKFQPVIGCFSFQPLSPGHYLVYMAVMLARFFAIPGFGIFPLLAGIAVLVGLSGALVIAFVKLLRRQPSIVDERDRNCALITAALTAYCLLFCLDTAYGRACGGLWTAPSSRYVNYLELGFLGLYFHLLSVRQSSARKWFFGVFVALVVFGSLHGNRGAMAYFRDGKQRWKECYLRTENIIQCDQATGFRVYPFESAHVSLQEKLQYLKHARQNLYSDSK